MLMPDMSMAASAAQPTATWQIEILASGAGSENQTVVVPDGVTEVSILAVADGAALCRVRRGSTDLIRTDEAIVGNAQQGGGNGGAKGADNPGQPAYNGQGGGGGAGGYDGNGGGGGNVNFSQNSPQDGSPGNGGGGGGGAGTYEFINVDTGQSGGIRPGTNGGGVGMRGKGGNGAGGQFVYPNTTPGSPGSTSSGSPVVGAGVTGSPGGNLRWRNGIAVMPGETLTINLGSSTREAGSGVGAGVRIISGPGRSYPSNAA